MAGNHTYTDGGELRFEAIGTQWHISLPPELVDKKRQDLAAAVLARIARFDADYSRFRPDSLVAQMAKQAGTYQLPADAEPLFDLYQKLYKITDGAVTPLIGQALSDAGYDADYTLQAGTLTESPRWEQVLAYDYPTLQLHKPALLDLGAAGKGYLVDIVAALLQDQGVTEFCVDAGGDIVQYSASGTSTEIALEHPLDPSLAIGTAAISNQSICGSSGNRRAWGKYHHILDPQRLASPQHIAGLWVIAADGLVADGLATALFFSPLAVLARQFNFEYAIVRPDGALQCSDNFPAHFYTAAV